MQDLLPPAPVAVARVSARFPGPGGEVGVRRAASSHGLVHGAGCGGNKEVIRRGEHAIRGGLADPMVHLYTAQAYADEFLCHRMGSRSRFPTAQDFQAAKSRRVSKHLN